MLKRELKELKVLLRSVPTLTLAFFVIAVVGMNLLANKSVLLPFGWLALDAGIILAWMPFLAMDVITKRFGAKASISLSIVATGLNLLLCGMFFIGGKVIPGLWGESFIDVGGEIVNVALDNTFSGTWYVLLGSTIAFLVSSVVNALLNESIGKKVKDDNSFKHFTLRSYISTVIGQFVDNLTFALIVSYNFFGWSILQCIMCAATGAIGELICEIIFSPFGFKVCTMWEKENVGNEYIQYIQGV